MKVFKSRWVCSSLPRSFCDRRFNLEHRSGCSGRRAADHESRIRQEIMSTDVNDILKDLSGLRATCERQSRPSTTQNMGGDPALEGPSVDHRKKPAAENEEREVTTRGAALWKPAC